MQKLQLFWNMSTDVHFLGDYKKNIDNNGYYIWRDQRNIHFNNGDNKQQST